MFIVFNSLLRGPLLVNYVGFLEFYVPAKGYFVVVVRSYHSAVGLC